MVELEGTLSLFLDDQVTYAERQESESPLQGFVSTGTMPPYCKMDPTGIWHVLRLSRGDQGVPPSRRRRQQWWRGKRQIRSFQEAKNHPAKNVSVQKIAFMHSKNVIQRCWYTRTVPTGVLLHWGTCTTPPQVNEGQEAPTGIRCTHFWGTWCPHAVQMTKIFP